MTQKQHATPVILSFFTMVTLCGPIGFAEAQQWNGATGANGGIWRSGNVAIGSEPTTGGGTKALLEISRPISGGTELLLSAHSTYKEATGRIFEVDTKRAYVGGARDHQQVLSASTDFAVGGSVAIGTVSITTPIPLEYRLAVGGKILAEEVRIKLIKDWADYAFEPTYRLRPLPEVEAFIQTRHHLPDMPSASEVAESGISVGEIQSKLLLKIEELTLHAIAQQKTIARLEKRLASMEQASASRASGDARSHTASSPERRMP